MIAAMMMSFNASAACTTTNPTPFTGLFEVEGNFVYFSPVVDEDDPNRGVTPVNPYGFDENTTYQVKIPSVNDTPTPLKVLESTGGKPNIQPFSGAFASGKDYTPEPNEPNPSFEAFAPAVYNDPAAPDERGYGWMCDELSLRAEGGPTCLTQPVLRDS